MYKLPPVLKTVQEPVNPRRNSPQAAQKRPQSAQNDAAKPAANNKDDIRTLKNQAPEKMEPKDKANDVDFSDLVSGISTTDADLTADVTNATELELDVSLGEATHIEAATELDANPLQASEIANSKLGELQLATGQTIVKTGADVKPIINHNQANSAAQAVEPETLVVKPETMAIKPENTPQPTTGVEQQAKTTEPTSTVQTPGATDDGAEVSASNDNVKVAVNEQASAPTVNNKIQDILDNLPILSLKGIEGAAEVVEKLTDLKAKFSQIMSGREPFDLPKDGVELLKDMSGLFRQITNLLAKANEQKSVSAGNGLPNVDEAELTQTLNTNIAKMDDAALQAAKRNAAMSNENLAKASKPAEALVNITNAQPQKSTNDNVAQATNEASHDAKAQKANEAAVQPALQSKYANRYNQQAGSENTETAANANGKGDESTAQNRSNAVYNNVKSSVGQTQNAANMMSALDKMNEKKPMDFLSNLQANMNNQALDGKGADNGINIKLAMQNGRLAQNMPINSMAFQMSKQFGRGNSEFQIRLDPAELGKINVKLTVKQGGNVKAHMVVERNDVFELMQRDARALERALTEAGFDGEKVEVELSLGQNTQQDGSFAENVFDQAQDGQNGNSNANETNNVDDDIVQMVANHIPLHVETTGIDRKV